MFIRSSIAAVRAVPTKQVRLLSTPKLHNATGNWDALKAKRPIDEDDLHVRVLVTKKTHLPIVASLYIELLIVLTCVSTIFFSRLSSIRLSIRQL